MAKSFSFSVCLCSLTSPLLAAVQRSKVNTALIPFHLPLTHGISTLLLDHITTLVTFN